MFYDELAAETRAAAGQLGRGPGRTGGGRPDRRGQLRRPARPAGTRLQAHRACGASGGLERHARIRWRPAGRWAPFAPIAGAGHGLDERPRWRRPRRAPSAAKPACRPDDIAAGHPGAHRARAAAPLRGAVLRRLLDLRNPPGCTALALSGCRSCIAPRSPRRRSAAGASSTGLAGEQVRPARGHPAAARSRAPPPPGWRAGPRLPAVDPLNLPRHLAARRESPGVGGQPHSCSGTACPSPAGSPKKPHYDPSLEGAERESLLRALIAGEAHSLEAGDV